MIIWWRICTSIHVQSTSIMRDPTSVGGHRLIEAVVFDVGGVLLDWNPRHLYRTLFADEAEMEWFLAEVCSPAWQFPTTGASRPWRHVPSSSPAVPKFSELIWAWSTRSEEMIGGVDAGSVEILREVREAGVPCYALTNMEAETYPLRLERFPFLGWFDGYRRLRSGRRGETGASPSSRDCSTVSD